MTDQTAIIVVIVLAVIFVGLWMFSNRQKRLYDDAKRQRRKELERIKAEARAKNKE